MRHRKRFALAVLAALVFAGELGAQPADPPSDFQQRWGKTEEPAPQPPEKREPIVPSTAFLPKSDVEHDLAALPEAVRRTRDRLIAAARTGDLDTLQKALQESPVKVMVDPSGTEEPTRIWRSEYPESEGREVLAILLDLLDLGYVRLSPGTPDEIYVWPYFAQRRLTELDPSELVDMFRVVTAYDYRQMIDSNGYTFFRIGIGADGAVHYFLATE